MVRDRDKWLDPVQTVMKSMVLRYEANFVPS